MVRPPPIPLQHLKSDSCRDLPQDGENLILDAKVFENMLCHLILIKHFAEKMILHTKDLPSFGENLRSNLVLAAKLLYSIGMKLLS